MHETILSNVSENDVKRLFIDTMNDIKEMDKELYEEIENDLYEKVYDSHFTDWSLKDATSELVNEDGTKGAHWTLEQTTNVAKQNGIAFTDFNEYDWNYVMNMVYSDYYGAIPNDLSSYMRVSKKFLEDKDKEKGKAYKYYKHI